MEKMIYNVEITKMDMLKDFIESSIKGIKEIEVFNLSAEDIIYIMNSNINTSYDFAKYYAINHEDFNGVSYIDVNSLTGEAKIKDKFNLSENDKSKLLIFMDLVEIGYSMDYIYSNIVGIDEALFKSFHHENAEKQLYLYNLASIHGKKAISIIESILNLYTMF